MSHHPQYRADMHAPYTPHFQPSYRYPIALAHTPKAGDPVWPGPLAPVVHASARRPQPAPAPAKAVRFAVPLRSRTSPAVLVNEASSSTSRRAGHVSAAPMLVHSPHGRPPLHFDAAYDPQYARLSGATVPLSGAQRSSLATSAPLAVMRLRVDPWSTEVVESAPGRGVRVDQVLGAVFRVLRLRVRPEEYARLDSRSRAKLDDAFRARVARAGPQAHVVEAHGIVRLDWLKPEGRSIFLGLAPTAEPDTWSLVLGWARPISRHSMPRHDHYPV